LLMLASLERIWVKYVILVILAWGFVWFPYFQVSAGLVSENRPWLQHF
jgi:hypothetical protein